MPSSKRTRAQREHRQRLQAWQEKQQRRAWLSMRRRRDNIMAAVAAAAVIAAAILVVVLTGPKAATEATGSAAPSPVASASTSTSSQIPDPALAADRTWTGTLTINGDPLAIELYGKEAPQAVANFLSLAESGFYDDVSCHRLTTAGIFVLQCGDPTGTGSGGPGYTFGPIENAPADDVYETGWLAMARVGDDASSMGSQFFIVYDESDIPSDSAGGYTVFGKITSGMTALDPIVQAGVEGGGTDGTPVTPVSITSIAVDGATEDASETP